MQTVQIRLTKELVKKSEELVKKGIYANKSEVARDAIRRLVYKENLTQTEKKHITLFASDLHGNIAQYDKLFEKALECNANTIILGGDITPKDSKNRTIQGQKEFILKKLIPRIKKFREQADNKNMECKLFLILGNDDFRTNEKILKENEGAGYKLLNNQIVKMHEDYKIIGYPYVPLTPFKYKDWEKLDSNKVHESTYRKGYMTKGIIARNNNYAEKIIDLSNRKDTIEKDLKKLLDNQDPRKVILATHTPPHNTSLDVTTRNEHVGSRAVKDIIKDKQPLITLHGHIHETVDMTGKFKEVTGRTISMSTGNYHDRKNIAIIKFDLYNPMEAERIVI